MSLTILLSLFKMCSTFW